MKRSAGIGVSLLHSGWSSLIVAGITFVSGIFIARLLGPADRGQLGEIQFWGGFLAALGAISITDGAVVRIRESGDEPARHLTSILAVSLGYSLLAVMFLLIAAEFNWLKADWHDFNEAILIISLVILIAMINDAFSSIERARLGFGILVVDRVVTPFIYMLLIIVATISEWRSVSAILWLFLLSRLPILAIRIGRYRHDLLVPPDRAKAWSAALLGARFHGASILRMLSDQADRLIIVSLWTNAQMGLYFVAYSAAGAGFSLLAQALQVVMLPAAAGKDQEQRRRRLAKSMRLTVLFSMAIGAMIIAAAPLIIIPFFGQIFAPAVGYTQWLAIALMPLPFQRLLETATRSIGHGWPGIELNLSFLAAVGVSWLLLGFDEPIELFVALTVARILAIALNLRHLSRPGLKLKIWECIVPRRADFREIAHVSMGYGRDFRIRIASRLLKR